MGVGIDLVDVARADRLLERHGDHTLTRLLTETERQYVSSRIRPAPYLAVRLAAKEAVFKALQSLPGARGVGWRDIEVHRAEDGKPSVVLHGLARDLTAEVPGFKINLSLSHSDLTAAAVAVIERDGV